MLAEKDKLIADKDTKIETERKRTEQEKSKNGVLSRKLDAAQVFFCYFFLNGPCPPLPPPPGRLLVVVLDLALNV